jgi:hypothetical protein
LGLRIRREGGDHGLNHFGGEAAGVEQGLDLQGVFGVGADEEEGEGLDGGIDAVADGGFVAG